METLKKNKTWELVSLPEGKKPIGCKWVYIFKYKADGSIERYKARVVAKGFTQTYGIDYKDLCSSCKDEYSSRGNLYGGSPCYEVAANFVCRLRNALYGLKQSPRAWFGRFTKAMTALRYKQSQGDHTLFIKHSTSWAVIVLLVYVDDIIVIGDDWKEQQVLSKATCKPICTLMDSYLKLGNVDDSAAVDKEIQSMDCLRDIYLQATHRILQYLKGPPRRGILYKRIGNAILKAYTNDDYVGSMTERRSTTGYCTFLEEF
ncbi:hypothetical protein CR513_25889, partial [Mucuna pruriens]